VINGAVQSFNCNVTISNSKQWKVSQVDPVSGVVISQIAMNNNPSSSASSLSLESNALACGMYKISFTVTMDQTVTVQLFQSTVFTYVNIVPAGLVIKLLPDSPTLINVGNSQLITLNATQYSYDPNFPIGAPQRLLTNFQWFCWNVKEAPPPYNSSNAQTPYTQTQLATVTSDLGGCFRQGPGRINVTNGALTFYSGNMHPDSQYSILVTTTAYGQSFSAQLDILCTAVPQTPILTVEYVLQ
jgi:hypothetical protein